MIADASEPARAFTDPAPAGADHRQPARQLRPPRRAAGHGLGAGPDDRRHRLRPGLRRRDAGARHAAVRDRRHRTRARDRPRASPSPPPRRACSDGSLRVANRPEGGAQVTVELADRAPTAGAGAMTRWLGLAAVAAAARRAGRARACTSRTAAAPCGCIRWRRHAAADDAGPTGPPEPGVHLGGPAAADRLRRGHAVVRGAARRRAWSARWSRSTSPPAAGRGRPVPLPPAGPALPARRRRRRRMAGGGRAAVADRSDPARPRSTTRLRRPATASSRTRPARCGRPSRRPAAAGSCASIRLRHAIAAQAPRRAVAERAHGRRRLRVGDRQRRPVDPAVLPRQGAVRRSGDDRRCRARPCAPRPRSPSSTGSCGCTSAGACCASASRPTACSARRPSPPSRAGRSPPGSGGIWVTTRTRARDRGAVRLLDAATGLAAGRRIVVGGRPTAIVTDGRSAWVLDSGSRPARSASSPA